VLIGAVGGPKWDTTDPDKPRPEQGLLNLRRELELYANLRPVRALPALYDSSPLKREVIEGTDLIVVRELTGGLYFGDRGRNGDTAYDTSTYSVAEVERIARAGFRAARTKVMSVDKANVLRPRGCGARRCAACTPRSSRTSRWSTDWSTRWPCSWSRRPPAST
jgi:3-isopropylmalate dehydrogenase